MLRRSKREDFMRQIKKPYAKPQLQVHGSVEAITGYTGDHDVFGGGFLSPKSKAAAKKHGPADFGS
jgi:hypothetical protein